MEWLTHFYLFIIFHTYASFAHRVGREQKHHFVYRFGCGLADISSHVVAPQRNYMTEYGEGFDKKKSFLFHF